MNTKWVSIVTGVLVVIGALNWGLVGAFDFNLVEAILGEGTVATRAVYITVGLAAIVMVLAQALAPRPNRNAEV